MVYKKIIAFSGIIFLLVIFNWNSINTPFERDEGEYAYGAQVLLSGGLPYRDSFTLKPPMIIYTYVLGQIIDYDTVWPPRILRIVFILGIIILTGLIIRKEYDENIGIASMYIITPMLSFPYLASLAANTEIFMLLPLMGTVALFIFNHEKKNVPFSSLFFGGFLGIMTLLYKPIAFLPLIFLFSVWLFNIWQKNKNLNKVFKSIFSITLGVICSFLLFLGYFLIKDGGKSFIENVIIYNSYYINSVNTFTPIVFRQLLIFWNNWFLLCILFLIYPLLRPKNWWLYLSLFFSSFLMIFKSNLYHYYIILIPFWALIISGSIYSISNYFDKKVENNKTIPIFTVLLVISMIIAVQIQFLKNPNEISFWIYGTGNPFIESKIIAQKISEITTKNDRIFIAGSEPQILFYANRISISRFVITYPFIIQSPMQSIYKKETIDAIKQKPPKVIVVSQREESGFVNEPDPATFKNFIFTLLKEQYQLIGGYVKTEKNSSWQENLTEEQILNSSLLLYKTI